MIIIVAIVVAVAVRLIVLFVIADQVVESETIVRGNEINAVIWTSPVVSIKIGATGESLAHLTDVALVAFPKTANRVAVFAVPFRPWRGEISHLITAVTHIPRLGD